MKKIIGVILAAVTAASLLLLPGCAQKTGAGADAGTINLYIWTEYLPQPVIDEFTKETGIKVNVSMYSDNEEMLSKVKSSSPGTYDIVVPSDYMVANMIQQGLLEKLDLSKIPNLSNIDPSYLKQSFDPANEYSVPYRGGVCELVVNKSVVTEDITSYTQLFDSEYANSIVALDDFRIIAGIVAMSLGYSANETDPAVLQKVGDRLMDLKGNIKILDSDSPKTSMINGEASIGLMWNAEASLAMKDNPDVKLVYPREGNTLFLDNLCIVKGSKNIDAAEKFLNYILDAKASAEISKVYPYLNPNTAAVALLGDDYKNDEAANIPSEIFAKGQYIENVDKAIDTYNDMWAKFTS
ncbi:spermidine/putrescine transport system substrate-binding protein [Sporobacter termitidis DSM 10068]|uniref:Spermidine/putrescine transport system substrate-binding protein n=1 Tax=Sporobacter termitidis DSM 10068 TaxID=1123282 RepID=A0A1M5XEG9_9FIRM|nr:spermidine/putrescine ABC transporter substrate-binding protein [Sporobacter termitidis]SHH98247.1 spermidine/putrescine transport system substrate-binding protein [Sporobacter termitidis DSM 10068]